MLVLARRKDEMVSLTDAAGKLIAVVMVVRGGDGVHGVRLGFSAPESVKVMRTELLSQAAQQEIRRLRDAG